MKSQLKNNFILQHLIEEQKVSGPVKKTINNSGLGVIKRLLCGIPPFLGGERYLLFGSEMHLRVLVGKKGKWKPYDKNEEASMIGGEQAMKKHKLFQELKKGAIIEKTIKNEIAFGIHGMHGTLDINNKKKGVVVDLKTTSCTTEDEFIKKAIKLGYPRQGVVYEELSGHSNTIFFGISKVAPYPVMIFDLNDFPNEKQKARQEAEFLLTFYKEFGLPENKFVKKSTLEGK